MGFPLTPRSMILDDHELLCKVKFSWNFATFLLFR